MAVEWAARYNAGFAINDLVEATRSVLASLLVELPLAVAVYPDVVDLIEHGEHVAVPAGEDFLRREMRELVGAAFVVGVDGEDAAVVVSVDDFGDASDPELGTWITVSADAVRTERSYVLGLTTVIAAAQLTGSNVLDEACIFGERLLAPDELLTRLRLDAPPSSFVSGALQILQGTTLR